MMINCNHDASEKGHWLACMESHKAICEACMAILPGVTMTSEVSVDRTLSCVRPNRIIEILED